MATDYAETNGAYPGVVQNGAVQTNGHKPSTPPSLEDFWMQSEARPPNIIEEMITTSLDPQEYIPRAAVNKREASAIQRFTIASELWTKRRTDIGLMVWSRLAYSIGTDGLGREQAVRMYSGLSDRLREGWQGIGQGFGETSRGKR